MKEGMKNKIILVLGLLTVIFFISSVSSYQDVVKQKKLVNQEIRARIELEEKALNLSNQNTDLEQRVGQLRETINREKATYETNSRILNQEISRLVGELEAVIKSKESLEASLEASSKEGE